MEKLFEVGDLGPIIDIPEELIKLTNDNQLLKAKNSTQKTAIGVLVFFLICAGLYIRKLQNDAIIKKEMTEKNKY